MRCWKLAVGIAGAVLLAITSIILPAEEPGDGSTWLISTTSLAALRVALPADEPALRLGDRAGSEGVA